MCPAFDDRAEDLRIVVPVQPVLVPQRRPHPAAGVIAMAPGTVEAGKKTTPLADGGAIVGERIRNARGDIADPARHWPDGRSHGRRRAALSQVPRGRTTSDTCSDQRPGNGHHEWQRSTSGHDAARLASLPMGTMGT